MRHYQRSFLAMLFCVAVVVCSHSLRYLSRGGTPETQQSLLPAEDNELYTWVAPEPNPARPQNCGNCHAEIYEEWAGTPHARSATNRRFVNLYEGTDWKGKPGVGWSLMADHPDGAGVCTACHAPSVAFDDPAFYDLRKVSAINANGVHCDYCHKVSELASNQFGLTHGRFALKLLRPTRGQIFFGPLADASRGEDVYSPIYRDSRYCAACHEGVVFGVHVYSTYSEWQESPARKEGKECQSCHMVATGSMGNFARGHGGLDRDPKTLGNHQLFAGSQLEMLRSCLRLAVEAQTTESEVRLSVRLAAEHVGHRVPTGFVDRNLVMVVEAFGEDGNEVEPRNGGPRLPRIAGKGFAGRAGRIYAKVLRDFDDLEPAPFWRAQSNASDSRLIPGQQDHFEIDYPPNIRRARVRLTHRRFWPEVAEAKGWPDNDLVVWEKELLFEPAKTAGK
jgi:hypothetical protein